MTHDDLAALDIGDSIIGFRGRWLDEHPIAYVGRLRFRDDGIGEREIGINAFGQRVTTIVVAGGREIRGARHGDVSFLKPHKRHLATCSSAT